MSVTSYNTTYHDDYVSSGNSDKNYLRILFKPGYSVQVRELNQLQSALQDQINRLGSSVWKSDTAVLGGRATFLPNVFSITLDLSTVSIGSAGVILSNQEIASLAKTITYLDGNLRGEVLGYTSLSSSIYKFYFNYISTGDSGETEFEGEIPNGFSLILRSPDLTLSESELTRINTVTYVSDGYAAGIVCDEGIFYTKGSFVAVPRQTYFIDKVDQTELLSGYAVLKIDEEIITYFEDNSLLDNANGTPNYSAPGADRYTIDLTLNWVTKEEYESNTTNSYVKLLLINSSRPVEIVEPAKYTEIIDILAKRTSEESGNYTLNPFPISIQETFDGDNMPVECIEIGRRYRIQDLGNTTGTLTDWNDLGAGLNATVGTEFIAVRLPGDGTNGTAEARGGGRVSDLSYPYGAYSADSLDQIGYDIDTNEKKRYAIAEVRDQYTLTLDPSVAYIDGYRVSLDKSLNLTTQKARETAEFRISTSANIGSYYEGTITTGLPTISSVTALYNLKDGATVIGECKIRAFEFAAVIAGVTTYRCYVHDVKLNPGKRFDQVDSIDGNNFTFAVTSASILDNVNNTALFKLPYSQAVSMREIKFYAQRLFSGNAASDYITISVDGGRVFTDTSDLIVAVGGVIQTSYTATMGAGNTSITLYNASWNNTAYTIIAKIEVGDAGSIARITKSKASATDTGITGGAAGSIYALKNVDIISLTSVITNEGKNITSSFKLIDNGQRDTIYTNGRVQYTGTESLSGKTLAITYEYYSRIGGVIGTDLVMYNVDSYSSVENSVGTAYDQIPTYAGVNLADVLDFRQDVLYDVDSSAIIDNDTSIIQNTNKSQIDPNTPITAYTTFYLPRIDAVTVNSRNEFSIINGISSLNPVEPAVPKNAMTLYILNVPAYTPNVKDIVKKYIDNRRYTMRDIGAIEKRISNIEYYTSLSLLERSAADKSIFDEGGERFKNGMLVDNFIGHGVGDVFDPNYSCSVDRSTGILRPRYDSRNVDLIINSTRTPIVNSTSTLVDSDKIRVHDSIITLNYEEVELVSHLKATAHISVHPHVYAKITGNIRLSPRADNWKDTITRPDLIVTDDSAFDAIKFIAEDPSLDILGTDWNNWEREWGSTTTTTTTGRNTRTWNFRGRQVVVPVGRPFRTTTTTREYTESRTGTNTTLGFSYVPKSLGTNVVDTAIIPFIRSRLVYFHASGLKENTRVYPFFDDRDISEYTNQVVGNDSSKFVIPANIGDNEIRRYDNMLPANFPTPADGYTAYGSELITSDSGELFGSFIIPNNNSRRFRTGERTFKLSDDPRNASSETTSALTKYTASGILETVQETILSTKTPEFTVTPLEENRSGSVTTTTTAYHDPLAQSFLISPDDYPTGVFITSIDIYFAQKALRQPVEIYVVTMENGAPTRQVVPYSRVSLLPERVQISDDASLATNFKFTDPVFLKADEEYSVIVSSNDGDYRCWYAILGERDVLTGSRIEKQEYLGTFFTSANAFTWTPQQEQDLKFRINRAQFFNPATTSSKSGNIQFRTHLHSGVEKIEITEFGGVKGGRGYNLPPLVEFNPSTYGARAQAVLNPLNGSVSEIIILDSGTGFITAPTITITKDPLDPGNPTVAATATAKLAEVPVSLFNLRQPNLIFNNTEINHSIQFKNEMPENIEAAVNNYLPSSYGTLSSHILRSTDQALVNGPRAALTSNLVTFDPAISPVIDVDGSSLLTIANLINNTSANETTENGSAIAKYITRKVVLNEPADWLNIYISTNRPTADTNIEVYVKLGFDTTTPDDQLAWVKYEPKTPIPINANPDKYSESEYKADPAEDFISFQVKIVMLSNNIFDIPTIRDFRAIATI